MIQPPEPKLGSPYNKLSPGLQFLFFTVLFVGVFFAGNIIGFAIAASLYGLHIFDTIKLLGLNTPQVINAVWILQIAGTSLPILITPIIFAKMVLNNEAEYLRPSFRFPFMLIVLVLCIMVFSSPLIEWLSTINEKMVLPKFLSGLQKWMRESEDQVRTEEDAMFAMPNVLSLVKNILFVGLFTAIAEELMFRGVIQTIFLKWTRNTHAAVWITGILFSAFHMQFFGFLPRLFLGVIFGYFVVWSGSIWPAVWAHFLNNTSAIVVTYLFQHKKINVDPDKDQVFNSALYISSLVVVIAFMFLYQHLSRSKTQLQNGEELA